MSKMISILMIAFLLIMFCGSLYNLPDEITWLTVKAFKEHKQ